MVTELSAFEASFEYNVDLFDASTITRLAANFETLLESIAATRHSDWVICPRWRKRSGANYWPGGRADKASCRRRT
jgi:hypothetical protein